MARSGMIVTVSTLLVILLWAGAYAQPQAPTVRGFHDISDQEKAARAAVAPTEVAEWAKRHVSNFVNIASGSPQVLLSRTVRASELPTLGLPFGNVNVVDGAPPLVLVVLRGDFRSDGQLFAGGNAPPAAQVAQVKYVALVYDLWAGLPTSVYISPNGGLLRRVLNDPSLPDDPSPPATAPTARPQDYTIPNPPLPPGATPVSGAPVNVPRTPVPIPLTPSGTQSPARGR